MKKAPKVSAAKRPAKVKAPAKTRQKQNLKAGEKTTFRIVGMGGSAGGLEAFEQFFSHLPPDTGMAFVLVPHLEPTHKGMMPELLGRHTKMKVVAGGRRDAGPAELRLRDSSQCGPVHPARKAPGARTGGAARPADADRLLLPAVGRRTRRKRPSASFSPAWEATARWA